MAYLPSFEGSASLWPCSTEGSTSCIGTAYRPKLVSSALQSLFCIVGRHVFCPAKAGIEVHLLGVGNMTDEEVVVHS